METKTATTPITNNDTFPILGTDHIEFYVGNAKQSAMYYQAAFGFELIAYMGPETGVRDRVSYVLQQGKIRFVLTSALSPDNDIAKHVALHGDGVKVLALWVENAEDAFHKAVARGAEVAFEPFTESDDHGSVVKAGIKTYGDTIHTLVERKHYTGAFLPGYAAKTSQRTAKPIGLKYVDHCVGNVELGGMNKWVKF